jgi:GR25 family glycosyltransferase involved in LPS biosynthesis
MSLQDFYDLNSRITEENVKKWNILFNMNRKKLTAKSIPKIQNKENPQVFISFTTCKRLNLFQETIRSILNHWEDLDKIDYWFCVDDNSSIDDRVFMYNEYPWFDFVFKTSTEKGHRESMNIIWNKLNQLRPKYWIHMEDDFLFYDKMNYVEESIQLFEECEKNGFGEIKQILFNRNYGETIEQLLVKGDIKLPFTEKLVLHNHCQGSFPYANCHYWPHYSFRPSMILTDTILELGNYNSQNTFFERDYANLWNSKGYKSAFFNKLTNTHIGRLTSERGDTTKPNAYILNNENQFSSKQNIPTVKNQPKGNKIKIINLKHREDRRKATEKLLHENNIKNYEFVEAVNGRELTLTQGIKKLFKGNDFGNRKGVIGCALSHYNLWKKLLEDTENSYYIIMEDDILEVCENFGEKIQMEQYYVNSDVLFLGYSMFSKNRNFKIYNENNDITIHPLNKNLYIGGTFGYSINKMGAYKLLDYINKNGIKHGIDYLIKIIPELDSYEARPQLLFTDWNEGGKIIDTDIQNDYDSFDFSDDSFLFFPKLDYTGSDLFYKKTSIEEMFKIANNDKNCDGFNTLGFFKHNIDISKLKTSQYFKENDGLYVKKFKNVCFIHSCHVKQIGLSILENLIQNIRDCGLKEIEVIVLNVGEPIEIDLPVKVVQISSDIKAFEILSINYIRDYCETNDCTVLYIHTKGINHLNNGRLSKVEDWKNMMLYFLLHRHKDCLHLLNTYDVVGCNYNEKPLPHFSGNFWWATSKHIRKLKPIEIGSPRHKAEWWLFTQPVNYYCIHHSKINHYMKNYPKELYRHFRVKMLCNWCSSEQLCKEWSNMCEYRFVWKNIEITWEDDVDFYVIINKPPLNSIYDPSRTIVFQMEPWVNDTSKHWGVKSWGEWSNPDPNKFLKVFGRKTGDVNNIFWQLELPLSRLVSTFEKTKEGISSICSSKYFDEGHIHRIDFLHYLEKEGITLDIYNQDNKHAFKNYRGPLTPYVDKSKGISPYKYYFMVENNYEEDFITEKLWEPILCETLVFYYGCPNIDKYVNPLSYVLLDMNDFEKSAQIIKQALEEDWWSQRIDIIRQEKERLLNNMAFFPRIKKSFNL